MENPNDLGILFPPVRVVRLRGLPGGYLDINPVRIRQLQAFVVAALPIMPELTSSDPDISALLADHREDCVAVVCASCEIRTELARGLSDEDLLCALGAAVHVNADFFQIQQAPAAPLDATPADAPAYGWADTLQALVSAGHRPQEILEYTLAQVRWWSEAISRARQMHHADAILSARLAWAESEPLGKVLRGLGVQL